MAITLYPLSIVGCGPGTAEYVTPLARAVVGEAEVLVGAQRLLDLFPESLARRITVRSHIEGILDEIEAVWKEKRVAVLVTGDPGFLSLAKPVIARFGRAACRVIAGISSLQVAFASLGLDWLDAFVVDAHGDLPDIDDLAIAGTSKIAVFAGNKGFPEWIVALAGRLGREYRIFVCSDLTLPTETISEVPAEKLNEKKYPTLSIVIFVSREVLP